MVSLTSCAGSGRGPAPNSFCDNAKPIYFDVADKMTRQTEKAIIVHNEKGAALCGWK
ncbi:MAG: hypothetical protein K0R61_49 [Microvirga sp.]|jgi:hypothetical protein|nr:hypothetical protein [Microvirga sp.]MDF2969599.1 hypothetical protein [Microvirga sp.]